MSLWGDLNNWVGAIGQTAGSLYGLLNTPTPLEDTSIIFLDGFPLPGIVQDEDVGQQLEIEPVPIEGRSGSVKLTHGFDDGTLRYTLLLTTDDEPDGLAGTIGAVLSGDLSAAIDDIWGKGDAAPLTATMKLEVLQSFFAGFDKDLNPRVYKIKQEQANARGITRVLFHRFGSIRRSRSDVIEATLVFMEYEPAMVLIETGVAAPPEPGDVPAPDTTDPLEE